MCPSIRTKLSITLLVASMLVAASMLAFMHWSFRQGLKALAETRQSDYIETIKARLVEIYQRDGDWSRLAHDPGLWMATLKGHGHEEPGGPFGRPQGELLPPPSSTRFGSLSAKPPPYRSSP